MLKFGMKKQPDRSVSGADDTATGQKTEAPMIAEKKAPDVDPQGPTGCDWWTPEMDQAFDEAAAQVALAPEQLARLKTIFTKSICEAEAEEQQAAQAMRAEVSRQFDVRWGQQSDRKLAAATQAASALMLDALALDTLLTLPNAVDILSALADLGEAMAEDGALPVSGPLDRTGAAGAVDDLARLKSDKDHVAAYLNPSHPGHNAAKRQRRALIDQTLASA